MTLNQGQLQGQASNPRLASSALGYLPFPSVVLGVETAFCVNTKDNGSNRQVI